VNIKDATHLEEFPESSELEHFINVKLLVILLKMPRACECPPLAHAHVAV